jgi:hypothetical protein
MTRIPLFAAVLSCCQVAEEVLDASVVNPEALQQQQQMIQEHQQHQQQPQQQQQQIEQLQQPQQAVSAEASSQHPAAGRSIADAQQMSGSSSRNYSNGSGESGSDEPSNGTAATICSVPRQVPRQGERISLTIRRVLKVHKALGLLKR